MSIVIQVRGFVEWWVCTFTIMALVLATFRPVDLDLWYKVAE